MNTPIEKHLAEISEGMTFLDKDEIDRAVQVLRLVRKNQGTVYLFGNGGSHTTASHFANDLLKMCRIRAVCIGDMAGAMLAHGNDNGWDDMFSGPLHKMMRENFEYDCAIGISCSGNSVNVCSALYAALQHGILTIGFTGMRLDSPLGLQKLNATIHTFGVGDIRVQEDLHLMVCHAIVRALQEGD